MQILVDLRLHHPQLFQVLNWVWRSICVRQLYLESIYYAQENWLPVFHNKEKQGWDHKSGLGLDSRQFKEFPTKIGKWHILARNFEPIIRKNFFSKTVESIFKSFQWNSFQAAWYCNNPISLGWMFSGDDNLHLKKDWKLVHDHENCLECGQNVTKVTKSDKKWQKVTKSYPKLPTVTNSH